MSTNPLTCDIRSQVQEGGGQFGSIRMLLFVVSGLLLLASLAPALQLKATFNMAGIKGDVTFSQKSISDSTNVKVNLTGISQTLSWNIHRLPMIYEGGASSSCANYSVGSIYNPDSKDMASGSYKSSCTSNARQNCAVGDLTGKLSELQKGMGVQNYSNIGVELMGVKSINGRTLVLSNGSTPVACALITTVEPMLTATAVFKGPIAGTIYLRQLDQKSDTFVFVNLFHVDSAEKKTKLMWRIDEAKFDDDYNFKNAAERCKASGGVYNPYSVQVSSDCNTTKHMSCRVGDMTEKHGTITASMATDREAETSAKRLFTDTNLPLKGDKSVIGHSIVLYTAKDEPLACANILEVKPRKAAAVFTAAINEGIEGSFTFSQNSPFDPTSAKIAMNNLQVLAGGYHVHDYPNPWYKNLSGSSSCAGIVAGGHWNPFGVVAANSPSPGTGTDDEYEVGDISGKYGTFLGLNSYSGDHMDYNLPLFGRNSIIGRSIVIHKNVSNTRWVCANLEPEIDSGSIYFIKTETQFNGPEITGMILMDQYKTEEKNEAPFGSMVYIDLYYKDNKSKQTMNHNWHVHKNPVGDDAMKESGRCASLMGHFNPYDVDVGVKYATTCAPTNMLRCEAGDLSGKHGKYNIGKGQQYYSDIELPLFGLNSIVGRGVVVHAQDDGAPRVACGNTLPLTSLYVEKKLTVRDEPAFDTKKFISVISSQLECPGWRITYIRTEKYSDLCLNVKFGIIGKGNQATGLSKKFDEIVRDSPGSLKEFKPIDKCERTSSAFANNVDLFLILLALCIGKLIP